MWVVHCPAVSHWVLIQKPCSRGLGATQRGGCDFRRNSTLDARVGSFGMASFGGNGVGRCSNVMVERGSRLACQQEYVVLVPVCLRSSGSFPRRELDLRFRAREGGNFGHSLRRGVRQFRRLNGALGSPDDGADVAEVSDDGKEKEVPADSLEFTHKVALDVLAPPDLVWKLWTDIKSAPQWMRWIDRVDFLDDDDSTDSSEDLPSGLSRLSRWNCSTIGFEVMWVARVVHVESNLPVRVLRWATVDGLPSRGEVTFKENDSKGTTVELSISHSLPPALGRVMQSSALQGLVKATLQTDLVCFQKYAAEAVNQQLECVATEEDDVTERKGSLTITTDCSQNVCDPL
ncbi:hypothetical protein M758_7G062900 [Ceratodon purpureus]|nr:hypothetical protein M758_7G062900 [Ceratodon purpureus]